MGKISKSIINLATSDDKPVVTSGTARRRTCSINSSKWWLLFIN